MSYIELKKSLLPLDYVASSNEMEILADNIANNSAPERIWFLEHPNIYTCGKSYNDSDILSPPKNIPIIKTERGGKVTFHGKGQRVVWLMLKISNHAPHIRAYIDLIQKWIIVSLNELGLKTYSHSKHVGIWIQDGNNKQNKIVAIGLRIRKGISRYGFAINISTNLNYYKNIIPCGITETGLGITSTEKEWKDNSKIDKIKHPHEPDILTIDNALINSFEEIFSLPLKEIA